MLKSDNSTRLLIGKSIANTASVQVTDAGTPATFIADGEIVVLKADGTALGAAETVADSPYITIVQGRASGKPMTSSVKIDGSSVIGANALAFRDKVEQQTFVGYNTVLTSGSIDAQPFTTYKMTIHYKNNKEVFSEQLMKRVYSYTTQATATQEEIVDCFVSLINNEEFFGALATKVDDGGTNFGIQLDGQALDFESPAFKYQVMFFEVSLGTGFGATTLTDPQVAFDMGSGKGEQIVELEYFCNGTDGAINRVYFPAATGRADADVSADYDVLAIESFDKSEDYAVSGTKPAKAITYIAFVDGAAQAAAILTSLNSWLASATAAGSGALAF